MAGGSDEPRRYCPAGDQLAVTQPTRCPCGSGDAYLDCCGRLHEGQTNAATARILMQSRFSAYVVGDAAYLLKTWHPSTRPRRVELDPDLRWTHLEVIDSQSGGLFDTTGVVEFNAHYCIDAQPGALHERSTFSRDGGEWRYLNAEPERR
jgi:SEC-C motif-containing protein